MEWIIDDWSENFGERAYSFGQSSTKLATKYVINYQSELLGIKTNLVIVWIQKNVRASQKMRGLSVSGTF